MDMWEHITLLDCTIMAVVDLKRYFKYDTCISSRCAVELCELIHGGMQKENYSEAITNAFSKVAKMMHVRLKNRVGPERVTITDCHYQHLSSHPELNEY